MNYQEATKTCLTRAEMAPWKQLFMNMYLYEEGGFASNFQKVLFSFSGCFFSHTRASHTTCPLFWITHSYCTQPYARVCTHLLYLCAYQLVTVLEKNCNIEHVCVCMRKRAFRGMRCNNSAEWCLILLERFAACGDVSRSIPHRNVVIFCILGLDLHDIVGSVLWGWTAPFHSPFSSNGL